MVESQGKTGEKFGLEVSFIPLSDGSRIQTSVDSLKPAVFCEHAGGFMDAYTNKESCYNLAVVTVLEVSEEQQQQSDGVALSKPGYSVNSPDRSIAGEKDDQILRQTLREKLVLILVVAVIRVRIMYLVRQTYMVQDQSLSRAGRMEDPKDPEIIEDC